MLYVAFTYICLVMRWIGLTLRKKPFCSVPCFLHSLTVACFSVSTQPFREDVKKETKGEKSKSTTENLWQHSAVCRLSSMRELEWLFLPRFSGGTEDLYRSILAFRWSSYKYVHCGCRGEKDWQIGRTLICSWILTGSYSVRKKLSPPRSYELWSNDDPVKRAMEESGSSTLIFLKTWSLPLSWSR